jgi:prevent-host-death family protein
MSNPSIISLSEFKAKASQLLEEMKANDQEIVLTQNGSAAAVVQDFASYQRLQESLLMMKLMVQGEADIRANRTTSQSQVFADLRRRLARKGG